MTDHLPPLILGDRYGRHPANIVHPEALYRVRWQRGRHWKPHNGGTRWNVRYYATHAAALRLGEKLLTDNAEVELTTYRLEALDSLRYQPKPPPPPRRRPPPPPPRRKPARHLSAVEAER